MNVKHISVKGNRITITFKGTPNYVQWQNLMWNLPMISPVQAKAITSAAKLTTYSPSMPIGTGPYKVAPGGFDPTQRVVYAKNAKWWGAAQHVSPSPKPKYIIDLVNTSNTNSLNAVLNGVEDLNNNYLPGVNSLVQQHKVSTYYPSKPYMLSANTAWLEPNTTHAPLNDPAFRRALAMALNTNQVVSQDYAHLVRSASPSGLLPTWNKYINKQAVKKYGFKYSPSKAKALLKKHGYKLVGNYFETKGGQPINLELSVPQGWSDWETARDMIVTSAANAGIKITVKVKDYNTWQSDRNTGNFDLVIDNNYQLSDNPWTYWNGIYHLPIISSGTGQTFANYERYSNPAAWKLVQKLDHTSPANRGWNHVAEQQAADDPHAEAAVDSTLVQRRMGAVHVEVLDELAVQQQPSQVRPGDVAWLPADDGDRRHHAPEEEVTLEAGRRPQAGRRPAGGGIQWRAIS